MALAWSRWMMSEESTEAQKKYYEDLYLKQIGARSTKRESELSMKRRLEELSEVPPAPGKKPALGCREGEGGRKYQELP